jgi:hypothetical protein
MKKLLKRMKADAKGCNKHLTGDYLELLDFYELNCFTHPDYREGYRDKFKRLNKEEAK